MAAGLDKAFKVIALDRRRRRVFQGMKVEWIAFHHGRIQNDANSGLDIVDQGKRCYRAWWYAKDFEQEIGFPEAETRRSDRLVQCLEIYRRVFKGNNEPDLPLFVLKEQILGVRARDFAAQCLRVLDGKERWMFDRLCFDLERLQPLKEVLSARCHLLLTRIAIQFVGNVLFSKHIMGLTAIGYAWRFAAAGITIRIPKSSANRESS